MKIYDKGDFTEILGKYIERNLLRGGKTPLFRVFLLRIGYWNNPNFRGFQKPLPSGLLSAENYCSVQGLLNIISI